MIYAEYASGSSLSYTLFLFIVSSFNFQPPIKFLHEYLNKLQLIYIHYIEINVFSFPSSSTNGEKHQLSPKGLNKVDFLITYPENMQFPHTKNVRNQISPKKKTLKKGEFPKISP